LREPGFLGFFKYFNFLGANLAWVLGKPPSHFWFDIVLPLGISFHTFQSMSYVVDVYRGEQKAVAIPSTTRCSSAFSRNWSRTNRARARFLPRSF